MKDGEISSFDSTVDGISSRGHETHEKGAVQRTLSVDDRHARDLSGVLSDSTLRNQEHG